MSLSYSLLLSENLAVPAVQLTLSRAAPALSRRRTAVSVAFSAGDEIPARIAELKKPSPIVLKQSSVSTPTKQLARSLGIRPSPELGLLSLLFVLTTGAKVPSKVFGFVWLVTLGIATMMDQLIKRGFQTPNCFLLCLRNGEMVDHLLMHCDVACQGHHFRVAKCILWSLLPFAICWGIWKERNRRTFQGKAAGAIFSLAFISIPALYAFRRLAASVDKLSEVVAEEVPGTLSSLKLSGLEINDLTQQLSNLRQKISGIQPGTKDRRNKPRSKGGRNNPIIN